MIKNFNHQCAAIIIFGITLGILPQVGFSAWLFAPLAGYYPLSRAMDWYHDYMVYDNG